jgi:pimeloyl-ACP methyl ester carboxylesterase
MRAKLAAAVALACLPAVLPSTAAGRSGPPVPRLEWRACGDRIQCATARVPLDHDRPHGRTVRLALGRLPAADRARRIGTLFFNPGGPGGSGVDYLHDLPRGFEALNRRFDIVGFDPRGVGASRPAIDCVSDRKLDALLTRWPDRFDELMAAADRFAAGCRARTPAALLDHVSTADVARDLDLLRRAVGDRRLTYVGFSYGTELGAVYATLFPGRARALALDGGVDPREYARRPLAFSRTVAGGNEAALRRFFTFCAAHGSACPLGGDPQAGYDALLFSLAAAPVPGAPGDRRVVDHLVASNAALAAMYVPDYWELLGDGLADAAAGDGAILQGLSDHFWHRARDGRYANELEAYLVIRANDSRSPRGTRAYRRHLEAMLAEAPHFADALTDAARRTLPIGEDAYRGRVSNPASAPTVLVVGSTHDNAAPYRKARAMTRELGNARLLTRDGDGHTAYQFSACIARRVNAYLIERTLPRAGTRCATDPTGGDR